MSQKSCCQILFAFCISFFMTCHFLKMESCILTLKLDFIGPCPRNIYFFAPFWWRLLLVDSWWLFNLCFPFSFSLCNKQLFSLFLCKWDYMLFPFINYLLSFILQVHFVLKELVRKSVAETEVRNMKLIQLFQ